jgi:hypothetical protein
MNHKDNNAPGVPQTIIDGEIAAGLAQLQISRQELFAEAELYPWMAEWPEVYERFSPSVALQARAVELLTYFANGGLSDPIADLDQFISELREVLLAGAAGRPSLALRARLKKAKKAADEELAS